MSVPAADSDVRAAAYWSGQAARYDEWGDLAHGHPRYRQAWTSAVAALLGRTSGAEPLRVVDVGTGTGEYALLLAQLGHRVTGYDIAPGMLQRARANIAAAEKATAHGLGGSVEVAEASASRLPVPDGSVQLVTSRMVFWALADPVAALREWRRVLAPGGRILVIDALHFRPPESVAGRIQHHAGQLFWRALDRFDRLRGGESAGTGSGSEPGTGSRRPASPGASWRSVREPAALFTAAGLGDVRVGWLDEVADAHRRTAALRWRVAGLLPRFYTLSWEAPAA